MPKSDIEIARAANMKPIKEILEVLNVPDDPKAFSPMGRHIAKINLEYLDQQKSKKVEAIQGKWETLSNADLSILWTNLIVILNIRTKILWNGAGEDDIRCYK